MGPRSEVLSKLIEELLAKNNDKNESEYRKIRDPHGLESSSDVTINSEKDDSQNVVNRLTSVEQ